MVEFSGTAVDGKGHGLLCPACKIDLVMSERQGIEIDYCAKCRGVWLDRGELDKIIEQSVGADNRSNERQASPAASPKGQSYRDRDHYDGGHGSSRGGHGRGRRNESFLGRLFD